MAVYPVKLQVQIVDFNGDTAVATVHTNLVDTTTMAGLVAILGTFEPLIAACTNGKIIRQTVQFLVNEAQYLVGTAPPTNAEYSSVTDGAHFAFANGMGQRTSITIPAPIEALFGANSNVVDPTQTDAAALIAAFAASTGAPVGGPYNLYKGGVKTGRHSRKRVTRLIP